MDNRSRIIMVLLSGSPIALVALAATGPGPAKDPAAHPSRPAHAKASRVLEDRSPGGRTGDGLQTKLVQTTLPRERVLSVVRERPDAPPAAAASTPHLSFADIPLAGASPILVPLTTPVLALGSPGPIVGSGPIGSSPTVLAPIVTGSNPPGDAAAPNLAPPPAVPEPVTWMTLLTGLGILAWRLRVERSASGRIAGSDRPR